ncbi:MAG: ergothioneine biosynthesis protein EgtB [Pseudomonadota bacterium]
MSPLDDLLPSGSNASTVKGDQSRSGTTKDTCPDGARSSIHPYEERKFIEYDVVALADYFLKVRGNSESLAAPLSPEDWMLQSMEDASPVKWNLAHTTWFFETFILSRYSDTYKLFNPNFGFLFNSYYNQIGEMHTRQKRGVLSRPSAEEVLAYRRAVTQATRALLVGADENLLNIIAPLVILGCAHEEQHQELLLTDIKHALYENPFPSAAYPSEGGARSSTMCSSTSPSSTSGRSTDASADNPSCQDDLLFIEFDGGLTEIGWSDEGFAFDNEGPVHKVFLKPFGLGHRLVTNSEYLEFMDRGGYRDPRWWLADGWARVAAEEWSAPLYWQYRDGEWLQYTLSGLSPLDPDAPVCHLSYYEAAAYAEWTGFRLATEVEWEQAAKTAIASNPLSEISGVFLSEAKPRPPKPVTGTVSPNGPVRQMLGDVWEWTSSPYIAYPGYRAAPGAIGEYNGKFMSSQMVLRGGSCATPVDHVRPTYRNFFPPHVRWQFSGLRLACDL